MYEKARNEENLCDYLSHKEHKIMICSTFLPECFEEQCRKKLDFFSPVFLFGLFPINSLKLIY